MAKKSSAYETVPNFSTVLSEILTEKKYKKRFESYLKELIKITEDDSVRNEYIKKLSSIKNNQVLSGEDIAFIVGTDRSSVNRWIYPNNYTIPNLTVVIKIAKVLGVTTDYLLGVDQTPDKASQKDYDAFKKYGFNPDSFMSLKELRSKDPLKYDIIVKGINLLLNQQGEVPFDAINTISRFLVVKSFDNYYYFDSDDVDDLFSAIFESKDSGEKLDRNYVRDCINAFLTNSPEFTIDASAIAMLDDIKDSLKSYKKQLTPNFFKSESEHRKFFELHE